MQLRKLPHSTLEISPLCLGTMTFGEQNTEAEAFSQLDYALERGINFIDTAEMYPVPPKEETQGRTEEYIGNWLEKSGKREKIVLATKVAGPRGIPYIRDNMALDWRNIHQAVDDSLRRLKTDYIDLYQIHWPERQTNCFGQLNYPYPEEQHDTPILETLEALADIVKQGKVRYIGLSNETPWGVMSYLRLAEKHGLPRAVSIQNPYNLLNRTFEVGLSEIAHHEGVELLAYSPLAFGVLSGKYLNDARPDGARCTLFERFVRYFTPNGIKATEAYVNLAREHGLDPAQMALAFVNQRPFVASNIIGATTMDQLKSNIDSLDVNLSEELLNSLQEIGVQYSNPCP
ncbi:oxidoreductase Tas aldo/keto reductase family protein [Vibrio nigripulchritudo ATCC 27043]|uniref:Protein tas n=1 Tax=Vibrio nigripulchritudo TaxID=28173 RepID=U4JUJ6_9VIBR|nr:NADP(H)-dependent aldo-keto reductase [Vibrio nigripulchritudo]EGU61918.1 oxidoreductase Tas aldo/keto reductase family protein [Vibrio nigripulchritudo ATCC 27043]CCN38401.1 putative aldo/keto reductase 2 family protein [Vibrio nigripulchritudo AM115]CCN41324.1 putative aldo/keto reductase 2 family protein [Vibrio nigripulchritudo FTn2]CCN62886.1 putative aldo/keto reductase 2 family protein [Vibrio nigripulchritudo POn4]CCN74715.1 putative aldo/keto reductase 2 family protein [Vibrio nigr